MFLVQAGVHSVSHTLYTVPGRSAAVFGDFIKPPVPFVMLLCEAGAAYLLSRRRAWHMRASYHTRYVYVRLGEIQLSLAGVSSGATATVLCALHRAGLNSWLVCAIVQLLLYVRCTVLGLSLLGACLLYTSPSPRDGLLSRMPSSA